MKKAKKEKIKAPSSSLLERLDLYFTGKEQLTFTIGLIANILFSLLLFEPKVSIGGDDSIYINRAYNLLQNGTFPTFQAPLYPMLLAVIISFSGINLIILKLFSLFCIIGHFLYSYKLFRHYLSPFLLFVFLILLASSASLLSFASTTYSEALYLFIQSGLLYYFDKKYIRNAETKLSFIPILITGLLLVLLVLTRNVGLVAIIAIVIYLLISKKWKECLFTMLAFLLFFAVFKILKISIWDIPEVQMAGQGNTLLLKNSFQPELGHETVLGFALRLIGNSVYYLGFHLFNIFGISTFNQLIINILVAIIVYIIFIRGFLLFTKKSVFWFFIGIYIVVTIGVTFFILQTYWNQERLIITIVPVLLAFLLKTIHEQFSLSLRKFTPVFLGFASILIIANLARTITKIPEQTTTIRKYIQGDDLYGFPEDWQNYLSMTKWVGQNLPKDSYVACRKPGMAFIYSGGKNFYGIWRVSSEDPEILYSQLKEAGVTHVIMASLRTNPENPDSPLIKTVRTFLETINKSYPDKLVLVHQTGKKWPVYLYELK